MATALYSAQAALFSRVSLFRHSNGLRSLTICSSFSSSAASVSTDNLSRKKWRQPVVSVLELGAVKISKEDVVRNDPTNNVLDAIFSKLGKQLHRRDNHPLGILKNTIYEYFDANFSNKFNKLDDLCPIVSVKQNFDDVLVPEDHLSRSYNDTYYIDQQTILRCHTSAHQAELLRRGYTHFLVTGDVYRRDSIDSTHYPVFHQMEGFRVFASDEWEASGTDATSFAAADLKTCLEGLARHLFGAVEMRWIDTYFPFTNPSFELEIYFQEKWLEVLGRGTTEQEILKRNDIRLFWSSDEQFTSQFSKGQLGIKFRPYSKYPPCYKDVSFWINESFTKNNLCEVVRGIAGILWKRINGHVQWISCFKDRKILREGSKATKKREAPNYVLDDKDISHILWWKERMDLCRKPSTIQLVKRLKYSNLLGLDVNLKSGS
ncbi:hypothetical protein L6164_025987 [Bauhinia variegata]|uniref:Uncharacterized protein n=1 Tax=Bauhinia variegata TaxID=167791 RepID=A0ACB9M2L4_BAUVA|nr:hypothetical protein L6164_025987 [Bauhinia variegata]